MNKQSKKPGSQDTNYVGDARGKEAWNARLGAGYVAARNWRLVAILALGVAVGEAGVLTVMAAKSSVETVIVKVSGDTNQILSSDVVRGDSEVDQSIIVEQVAEWIRRARSISIDGAVMKQNVDWVYNRVNNEVATSLTAYYRDPMNDPRERAKRERVSIEVTSLVWLSKETLQIDWIENRFDRAGEKIGAGEYWRGAFTVKTTKPKTTKDALNNPIGLAIVHYDWDKVR